jgi:carboxymethylenebutenolidase
MVFVAACNDDDWSLQMVDLGAVFDKHVASEFAEKDVDATMRTMVEEPYVWHVPPLTGATGGAAVREFYSTQFIGRTPDDAVLRPIARTVSEDRVIDEFVLEFTHDREIPFMLPGVAPTGGKVRIPTVVVMGFKDGKVACEHIYWDQASSSDVAMRSACARLTVGERQRGDRYGENRHPSENPECEGKPRAQRVDVEHGAHD